jgi:glutamate-ammonia-ligase adenylyltransferase
MGKLGGEELNYASDLDVLFVYDAPEEHSGFPWAVTIAEGILQRLAATTEEGTAFKVDASLRPEGKSGQLVRSLASYRAYYERWAQTWEFQALLKARFVAGDATLGGEFTDLIRPLIYAETLPIETIREIRAMKARIEKERLGPREDPKWQLKVGAGGTIDIEFTIQLLQMRHGAAYPRLRVQGTIAAINSAAAEGLIGSEHARWLVDAYRFLSRTRNVLTLVKGRPIDSLPRNADELEMLGRAMGYPAPGARLAFAEDYRRATRRARRVCEEVFYGKAR